MAFTFPAGFTAASGRLGTYYNGDARTPQNPGGMDQYGYVENFIPALRDATALGGGLASFATYLETTVSPLAQAAVDAAATVTAAMAATAADRVQTGADRSATGQDRVATGQDRTATAADRVVTGQDRTATGQDKVATAADRVATGQDKNATAADRVQTGQDRAGAAISANKLSGTSSTSNAIGTGAKTFTTQADKFFGAGSTVTISSDSNPSGVQMSGVVTGYSGVTLVINAQRTAGTGTYTDWTIRVSGAAGANGSSGWTPVFANATRGADVVQRIVDWTGGSGTKPTTGSYVGPTGFVENIADATNVRGLAGAGGGNVNPSGTVDTNHVALFSDATGNLIKSGGLLADVASSGDYADLAGTPTIPTVPGDIGAAEASALAGHVADTGNPHGVTKAQVELGNVANLAPADLPLSDDAVDALALKAALASPSLTGTPLAPTAAAGTNTTQLATLAFVIAEILARRGAANGIASLGSDSKILSAQLPALAITDTFEVASQAAMLALTAERGDVAVRSDINKSYILKTEPATTLANWVELKTPTDVVLAVAGLTGTITASDLRAALSLVIGTNVQAYDADLAAIAALATTTFGRGLLTLADAAGLLSAAGGLAAASKATAADIIAGTEDAEYVTPKGTLDAMAFVTFTASSIDLASFINGKITLAANTTFAAPTNAKEGMTGVLQITQDGTGGRIGTWNTFWNFGKAGVPTLSTGANKVDLVSYVVRPGATQARCSFLGDA